MVTIMLVDDHVIVRQGIRLLLEEEADFSVIGEAESGDQAIPVALSHHPDVILMDVHMPQGIDGITATRRIREELPHTNVIMLTMFDDEAHMERMLQAGAAGILFKNGSSSEIVRAIQILTRGGPRPYLPTQIPDAMRTRLLRHLHSQESTPSLLSPRETEVLTLIAKGYINKEIAERLHISIKTVETHRARIIERIGAETKADLVSYAVNHGLIHHNIP